MVDVPFAADRRTVDSRDRRRPESPRACGSRPDTSGPVDLGVRDRVDHALPGPGAIAGLQSPLPGRDRVRGRLARRRVTGEKLAVRAAPARRGCPGCARSARRTPRSSAARTATAIDAVERAVRRRPPPRKHEERRAETCSSRGVRDVADIGAEHRRPPCASKKSALARVAGRPVPARAGSRRVGRPSRSMRKIARSCGSASTICFRRSCSRGWSCRTALSGMPRTISSTSAMAPLDGLEDLERVLVKDIERALDPIIGDGVFVAIVQPGGECEQQDRQDGTCHHHQLQQSNC